MHLRAGGGRQAEEKEGRGCDTTAAAAAADDHQTPEGNRNSVGPWVLGVATRDEKLRTRVVE